MGRKTANVVLGHALGVPGLPVDRHVLRVANRIGLVKNDDPVKVEAQLVRDAAARAMDAGVGRAHPARPPHLQAEAAVPALQRPAGLRFLSAWFHDETREEDYREASTAFDSEDFASEVVLAQGGRQERAAPVTREEFRELVEEAIDTIPLRFAREVRNLAIVIEDEPSDELLDEMEMDPDDTLLGLYQGTPLNERGWGYGNQLPDRITLFQRHDRRRMRRRRGRDRRSRSAKR